MSADEVEVLRRWHERAYAKLSAPRPEQSYSCLGLDIVVPGGVFPPVDAESLGAAVVADVAPGERVLDLGTGSGIHGLLAARAGADVVAVDLNPAAVQAAAANARRNGLSGRVLFAV